MEPNSPPRLFRVLSLDGGGAKGFYTLGVLKEIEGMIAAPLASKFDLVFGTSTGAIIAALIGLGKSVDEIHELYKAYVPEIMQRESAVEKSKALRELGEAIFQDQTFESFQTRIGIVATHWDFERPMIFKTHIEQVHGRAGTFIPGFGCTISDAVQASCSAYPFFERKLITTETGDKIAVADGGYCANNPTLYALADATTALGTQREKIRTVNVGVGIYPTPRPKLISRMWFAQYLQSVQLLQKTLEINTQSMDQLRAIIFKDVPTVRISDTFEHPEMATDLFEHNLDKLNLLRQRGRESFASREQLLRQYLM